MGEVVLVAVETNYPSMLAAQTMLIGKLKGFVDEDIDSWWFAEDERYDRSDCDSAVFVKPGKQAEAVALLREHGLAYEAVTDE